MQKKQIWQNQVREGIRVLIIELERTQSIGLPLVDRKVFCMYFDTRYIAVSFIAPAFVEKSGHGTFVCCCDIACTRLQLQYKENEIQFGVPTEEVTVFVHFLKVASLLT